MAQIDALPFPFAFRPETMALVVIDMQRDFAEPGGFGASLGNDVSRVQAIVPTVKRLIEGFRATGLPGRRDASECTAYAAASARFRTPSFVRMRLTW